MKGEAGKFSNICMTCQRVLSCMHSYSGKYEFMELEENTIKLAWKHHSLKDEYGSCEFKICMIGKMKAGLHRKQDPLWV